MVRDKKNNNEGSPIWAESYECSTKQRICHETWTAFSDKQVKTSPQTPFVKDVWMILYEMFLSFSKVL
jgi:hypothetical protein